MVILACNETINVEHIDIGEIFLNRTPMAYALRSTIEKWDLIKLKSFCNKKETVNKIHPIEGYYP